MLTIRPGQLEAFRETRDEGDVETIAARMRVSLPHVAYASTDEVLRDGIRAAIRRGRALGMNTIEGCQALARLLLEIGPDCEALLPELAAILRDPRLPPDERPGAVLSAAPAAEWRRRLEAQRAES